jgi:hypothetical protein
MNWIASCFRLHVPCAAFIACCSSVSTAVVAADPPAEFLQAFLRQNCADCHQADAAEGGLDVTALETDLNNEQNKARWIRIFDRVNDGEMPPDDVPPPDQNDVAAFLKQSGSWLTQHQRAEDDEFGRVRGRRLTRRELERSLHDLLCIDIPLADQLPEESKTDGFSTVAAGQSMSHFQLARYLDVLDQALDESWRRAFTESDDFVRELTPQQIARSNPKRRCREPEMREELAVIWSSGLIFYGRLPATTAPEDGWYHFKVRVSGLKLPETGGVWSTVRTGLCVSSAPLLPWVTSFEATAEPQDIEFDAWLPQRHMLEIRPGDVTLKRGRFAGGQVGVGEGEPQDLPGIAFHRISMRRVHKGPDDQQLRQTLFGDLHVVVGDRRKPGHLKSDAPREDAVRLLRRFATRAWRQPVSDADLSRYVAMVHAAIDDGSDLATAFRIGCRGILCSPRFLYLAEEPGRLNDYEIAARLSYFLTGTTPDTTLTQLAAAGRLQDRQQLIGQADRLLQHSDQRFLRDFAAEWLDLDQISFTEPDRRLYPGFDPVVEHAMLDETHAFLADMLQNNRSVTHLVDADFTYLNSRLARYYGIEGVQGDALRVVKLPPDNHRGGVLTQGAIMKVTANGSNTSPVIRGVWASERILGQPIAPPPGNVPAIEPDIRGAKTIRDMLAKHRNQATCASCHVKIDPPGFALENFDPSGRWRDRYIVVSGRKRQQGPAIDASYEMPDGRPFANLQQFKSLVTAAPEKLAKNVAEKMITYGTGAAISFADRQCIEEIVEQSAADDYGFRTLLHNVITHKIFLTK